MRYWVRWVSSLMLLLSFTTLKACIDYPTGEYTRLSSFYCIPSGMQAYMPFIYTYSRYYCSESDPFNTEKEQILDEWQNEIGPEVPRKDIELILYQASPNMFLMSYLYTKLNVTFEGNRFVDFITKPEHKAYLDYIVSMKQTEYIEYYLSDRWTENYNEWFNIGIQSHLFNMYCNLFLEKCKIQLPLTQLPFLKVRYHYQLAKMLLKRGKYKECEEVARNYLSLNPKSILNNGILHYLGVCYSSLNDSAQANVYFARSFRMGNERKFRNMQLYYTSDACVQKSILLTQNNSEKALIIALSAMRNPGHALVQLKQIANLDAQIPEFLFLIYREINKFDDWIITPVYTNSAPTISNAYQSDSVFRKIIAQNLKNDKQYAQEFMDWLGTIKNRFTASSKQYLDLAFVHLNLLIENYSKAKKCFNSINIQSDSTYIGSYKEALMYLKIISPQFNSDDNLNALTKLMKEFEPAAKYDPLQAKMLSTLNTILAYKLNKLGRNSYAALVRLKGELYAGFSDLSNNSDFENNRIIDSPSYFDPTENHKIEWLNRNASIRDIDTLIQLCRNNHKMFYQSFYSDSNLGSVDLYLDLKGNMAYRCGKLSLANESYKQMNPEYWNMDEFKSNMCEDPFVPKYWPTKRNFHYHFDKAVFTSQLLNLEKESQSKNKDIAAAALLKLGHAYYNSTWWGNAWMMCEYYRTSVLYSIPSQESDVADKNNPYDNCSFAKKYYLSALKCTKNKEYLAVATFMLHAIDLNNARLIYEQTPYHKRPREFVYKTHWLVQFAQKFQETEVYRNYLSSCTYLTDYIKNGHLTFN